MSGRLATLGGALLALIVAIGLLFSRVAPVDPPGSRPGSRDGGPNGLLALSRWLERSGSPVWRLNTRYDSLERLPLPAQGNLLVVPLPMAVPLRDHEAAALKDWVARGNGVLVLGPVAQWLPPRQEPSDALFRALGLVLHRGADDDVAVCKEFAPARAPKTRLAPKPRDLDALRRKPPQTVALRPAASDRRHPLLAGVDRIEVAVPAVTLPQPYDYPVPRFAEGEGRLNLVWLCDTEFQQSALAQFRLGDGLVWVSGYEGLFDNAHLGRADNARLFANLLGQNLRGDGAVIFDDVHQGDSELYDPSQFFRDPRLHASVGLLLLIWLLWLLAYDERFAPPQAPPGGVTPAAFARRIGGFYARSVAPAEAAQTLLTRFHAEVRRRLRQPGDGPAWALLEAQPGVDPRRLADLRAEAQRVEERRRTRRRYPRDLRPLLALIHHIQESIR